MAVVDGPRRHPFPRYHAVVIRRLYVHNFRCLENFELSLSGQSSVLLIGKNGAGKSTVGLALEILQKAARGANRVGELVQKKDFARDHTDVPIRIEFEAEIASRVFTYVLALDFPKAFREPRVVEEKLSVDGNIVYSREMAQVQLVRSGREKEAGFRIDWHMVALPIIQEDSVEDPIFVFRQWLSRMLLLRPVPSLISGNSTDDTLKPSPQVSDFGAWFSGLIAYSPSAYSKIDAYLKQLMPDLEDIKNPIVGKDSRSLEVRFKASDGSRTIPFEDLSDGEKCFMICSMVLAANAAYGPLVCFWDEPDNFLALSEVGHFALALRRAFLSGGQFVTTSHNPEAIRSFADVNTLVLYRENHLVPTRVRPLTEMNVEGDLIGALIRGEVG